jgi:hypothetical protein
MVSCTRVRKQHGSSDDGECEAQQTEALLRLRYGVVNTGHQGDVRHQCDIDVMSYFNGHVPSSVSRQ